MKRWIPLLLIIILMAVSPALVASAKNPTPIPEQTFTTMSAPNSYTISGTVYDASYNGIPDARVTLYFGVPDSNGGTDYKAYKIVNTDNNPQYTDNLGTYEFTDEPASVYVIVVEKDGVSYQTNFTIPENKNPHDIHIPGYIANSSLATPTPTPPGATYSPTPDNSAQPSDAGAILSEIFNLSLMAIVGVQLIVSMAILVMKVGRN
jgi:hypothetical protein